jgi:hypothetical protein
MTVHHRRILTECDTMLAHITTRYGTTLRRLYQAQPGFPPRTPASGEPGGGKGFTTGSITERLAGRPAPERTDLLDALTLPNLISTTVMHCATDATLTIRNVPAGPRETLRRLVFARWILLQLVEQNHEPARKPLEQLHRHTAHLHGIVTRWGGELVTPKKQPDLIPTDLTEMWCTSCLRIGDKNPRHRGDRCRFCYDWERQEGFLAPTEILETRKRRRLTERDVERCRKDWRERTKGKKRRRAV